LNLDEGNFLDSASTPFSASSITLAPLPTRQRLSGDLSAAGDVGAGVIDTESLVVLSSTQLPSIFF
jgi:hypothetical protein